MSAASERVLLRRRDLLGIGLAGGLLAGCDTERGGPKASRRRVRYGPDPQQYADLRRPRGRVLGTVVLIHGGYWQAGYGADQLEPLARAFNRLGHATWNVEYRRVGSGGGFPATLQDVAAALDRLDEEDLPDPVVVGHSAGGHLAVWAASRTHRTPGGAPRVAIRAAISLAGLLDLTEAARAPASQGPTVAFMGGSPQGVPERYAAADPALLVPARCPVHAAAARSDQVVPSDQARRYVAAARAAGGEASYVSLPGDHFAVIDPGADAFPTIRGLVTRA